MGKGKAARKLSACDIFLITGIVLGGLSILVIAGLTYRGILGHKSPHREHICQVDDVLVKHVRCQECIYDLADDHHTPELDRRHPQPEQDGDMDRPPPPEGDEDRTPPPESDKDRPPPPEGDKDQPPRGDDQDHPEVPREDINQHNRTEEENEWWMKMFDEKDMPDDWRNKVQGECPPVAALLIQVSYKLEGQEYRGMLHEDKETRDSYPMHSFVDCGWRSGSSSDSEWDNDFPHKGSSGLPSSSSSESDYDSHDEWADSEWENDFPHKGPSGDRRRKKRQTAAEESDELTTEPDHDGRRPDHDGRHPDHDGRRPDHDGRHPDHDGRQPDHDGEHGRFGDRKRDGNHDDFDREDEDMGSGDPFHDMFDQLTSSDLRAMAHEFTMMHSEEAGFPCYSHPEDPQHLMYEAPFWSRRPRCRYMSWPVCITAGFVLALIIKKIVECVKKPKRVGSTIDVKQPQKGDAYIVPEVIAVPNVPNKETTNEKDPSILGPEVVPNVTLAGGKTVVITGLTASPGMLDKEAEAMGLAPETPRAMVDAPYPPVSDELPRMDSPPPAYNNLPKY